MTDKKEPLPQWTPKRKEMSKQCASCPFKDGNNEEFGRVMKTLAVHHDIDPRTVDVDESRYLVRKDVESMGDFICHETAYDFLNHMTMLPEARNKQCPGATKFHRDVIERKWAKRKK
jgi:hypothetical protein